MFSVYMKFKITQKLIVCSHGHTIHMTTPICVVYMYSLPLCRLNETNVHIQANKATFIELNILVKLYRKKGVCKLRTRLTYFCGN